MIDVRIINALYRSVETRRVVKLPSMHKRERPTRKQQLSRPAVDKPELIRAAPPSGKP